jgi:hypothetical protein
VWLSVARLPPLDGPARIIVYHQKKQDDKEIVVAVTIKDWSVTGAGVGPYTPPELAGIRIHGKVYGHPRFDDGAEITTSSIVRIAGRVVQTASGSIYLLGQPEAEYIVWCKRSGWHIPTEDEPIKIKGKQ